MKFKKGDRVMSKADNTVTHVVQHSFMGEKECSGIGYFYGVSVFMDDTGELEKCEYIIVESQKLKEARNYIPYDSVLFRLAVLEKEVKVTPKKKWYQFWK